MRLKTLLALIVATAVAGGAQAQADRKPPYWASIAASEAMMRTGPGKNYPAKWLYRRADLPIKVLQVQPSWRKVQDPDGETGWMLVNLLSSTRTAMVRGNEPRPMHLEPSTSSPVRYRTQPGVVGRLASCNGDWCEFDVAGRRGYIQKAHLWGVDQAESF